MTLPLEKKLPSLETRFPLTPYENRGASTPLRYVLFDMLFNSEPEMINLS